MTRSSCAAASRCSRANVKTQPYPGFPTDMQPQIAVVLSLAQGTSLVTEGVYGASRFKYLDELRRMGAHIQVDGRVAVIEGVEQLEGAPVHACDLRAGAALVIAGLAARGHHRARAEIQFIERGYEDLVGKLRAVGADIQHGGRARRSGRERGTDQLKHSEEIPASAAYGGRWFCLWRRAFLKGQQRDYSTYSGQRLRGQLPLVIDAEGTRILVDAGISARRIKTSARAARHWLSRRSTAILITHEHSGPHLRPADARQAPPDSASTPPPPPRASSPGASRGSGRLLREVQRLTPFTVGAARITPFETSHDAAGSIDYRIDAAGGSVGILTDTGLITDEAADVLAGAALLSAREQPRRGMSALRALPLFAQAADSRPAGAPVERCRGGLRRAAWRRLGTREIVLAHLSRENNTPAMALERVGRALSGTGVRLSAAPRRELGGPYIVEVSNAKGQHPLCGETEGEVLPRCSGGIQ